MPAASSTKRSKLGVAVLDEDQARCSWRDGRISPGGQGNCSESDDEESDEGGVSVAGLGSRFLPATKASPKEMMPIVDKP